MFLPDWQSITQTVQQLFPCPLCQLDRQSPHGVCLDCWQQLPWLEQPVIRQQHQIQVAFDYTFPINQVIQQFKYEQQLHFQHLLCASLMQLKLKKVQAVVAMPISKQRLQQRGYNQMLIIAQRLSRQLQIPVWQPVTRLAQHSQKGLSRVERMQNIEQQFQIVPTQRRKYRKVLLIDDVVTTGSSISAMYQALQKLGCQQIDIACIAAAQH